MVFVIIAKYQMNTAQIKYAQFRDNVQMYLKVLNFFKSISAGRNGAHLNLQITKTCSPENLVKWTNLVIVLIDDVTKAK